MQMKISQLPSIPQAPANADVLAVEVDGVTYKVSKQALASAIAQNITPESIGAVATSDVIDTSHGGTNAGNVADALLNLGASIRLDTASWSDIYAKLSKIPVGHTAGIYTSSAVGNLLTGNKVAIVLQGVVSRTTTSGTYTFLGAYGTGQYLYAWRISGLTSASATPTISTIYQFTGTTVQ